MADSNSQLFDYITENQLQLLRVDASLRRLVLQDLNKLEKEITSLLLDSELSESRQKVLKSLLVEVQKATTSAYETINANLEEQYKDLADIEASGLIRKLESDSIGIVLTTTALPAAKLISIAKDTLIEGAPSSEWWSRQSRQLGQKFADQMRMGLAIGETNDQLIRRVRGTKAFNYSNGIMEITRTDADALVRSSAQAVANEARLSVFESNEDLIESYRHVSTLDNRTSATCIVRDGKRWDAKTKEPIGHNLPFIRPPLHWRCRSTLVAELKGVDLSAADRASQDGPVSSKVTFEKFLSSKSQAWQDEVLGKGKAQLWRDGKITLRQLLDQTGNPLSLKELRAKYA